MYTEYTITGKNKEGQNVTARTRDAEVAECYKGFWTEVTITEAHHVS